MPIYLQNVYIYNYNHYFVESTYQSHTVII